jgi:hypothetical protein
LWEGERGGDNIGRKKKKGNKKAKKKGGKNKAGEIVNCEVKQEGGI